jgi:hypothetical protein
MKYFQYQWFDDKHKRQCLSIANLQCSSADAASSAWDIFLYIDTASRYKSLGCRPVALTVRAPDSKSGGWGFESLLACHFAGIAHSLVSIVRELTPFPGHVILLNSSSVTRFGQSELHETSVQRQPSNCQYARASVHRSGRTRSSRPCSPPP